MHLLLVACSLSKDKAAGTMPALYRYTGPSYRILQKLARERGLPENLDIFIISGKFGLVRSDTPLPYYDQRISRESAIRSGVSLSLKELFEVPYETIFVNMGADYRELLDLSDERVVLAAGRIGEKNGKMKKWVEGLY